jgi:hypothetical protein
MGVPSAEILKTVDLLVVVVVHLAEKLGDFELLVPEEQVVMLGLEVQVNARVGREPTPAKAHVSTRQGVAQRLWKALQETHAANYYYNLIYYYHFQ